ncbi:MAG: phosphoribosylformylglycinamidine synthase subunit PurL, partial [Cytophagales bacterium]|nr:phosphoribosylformylglycinamidine synthase subunit PurL [Cytophagales bacterium]
MEKLLLEATLEVIATKNVIGIQDMGAAGIICSTAEMSAKGESGMEIWLDKVPMRQANMKPFELLLSESQERMLVIIKKGKEDEIKSIFDKWDLNCAQIGVVTNRKRLHFYMHGELVADVPAEDLVLGGGAPVYHREYKEPAYFQEFKKFKIDSVSLPKEYAPIAKYLLSRPSIASKAWVYKQYDSMVGTVNMTTNRPSDAAVVNIKGTNKALAMCVDCNGRYVNADPEIGCQIAVSEAARNVVCSGGEPVAITNNLNFGNPYNPEVYWQFVGSIQGMKKACEKFSTPVTGGNVSFYNQSKIDGVEIPVFPTPTIGMLGILEDKTNHMTLDFKEAGDLIYLLGESKNCISSSEYLYSYLGVKASPAPDFDLDTEFKLQETIKSLIKTKAIESAHDVSDGGLIITLTEAGFQRSLGFSIKTDSSVRKDAFLFGESQSRVVVTVKSKNKDAFEKMVSENNQSFALLGQVTKGECIVDGETFFQSKEAKEMYDNVL